VRLNDEPGRLLFRDSRRLYRVLGALMALGGGLSALAALGLVGDVRAYPMLSRTGAGLFGAIAFTVGVWLCWHAPLSTVVVIRAGQTVTLTRRGLFRTTTESYPGSTIAEVRVTKERDGKERPIYRVELVLDTGQAVPVFLSPSHDREGCMRAAELLWTAVGLPKA